MSYTPQDASTDHLTDSPIHNWMGGWGALIANHLFQWLGLGSFSIPLVFLWSFLKNVSIFSRFSPLLLMFMGIGASLFQPAMPSYPNALSILLFKIFSPHSVRLTYGFLVILLWLSIAFKIKKRIKNIFRNIKNKKTKKKKKSTYTFSSESIQKEVSIPFEEKVEKIEKPNKKEKPLFSEPKEEPSLIAESLACDGPISTHTSLPALGLLAPVPQSRIQVRPIALEPLQRVLEDFGVKGQVLKAHGGPVVSLYEFQPSAGVKSSRIISLADDIARSMSALSARVAPIPGKNVLGIELSNPSRETIFLREILSSTAYHHFQGSLPLALGKDISGGFVVADLCKMPHVLVAGTTGSGKSVGLNTMILSLIYRLTPEECRFIFIDPKMLELSIYNGIPHLLTPVVCDPSKAIVTLKWVVQEMENRYRIMSQLGVRHIAGYHQHLKSQNPKASCDIVRKVQVGFDQNHKPIVEDQKISLPSMPFIVVIIDEIADLMIVAGKEVEVLVQRLAQMARAAGIHLIMATQRPSVDVLTGTIKANFPTRISFQVASKIDSRTILGEQGAEHLLGMGDMLYMASGGRLQRVHGAFVGDEEIDRVVTFLKKKT